MSKTVKRLYGQFVPENYKLEISIDTDSMKFSGKVLITGKKIGRPSKRLTFHQKKLKVTSATISKLGKNGREDIVVERINNHDAYDEIRLHSDSMLFPDRYEISLGFDGIISNNMTGLYPCYFDYEGQTHKIFATQFESHHAREVFPCIDEPEAKATFDLTLNTPTGQQVLSNTPTKKQKKSKNQLTTTFEQTPVMSVYLLAFVVGEIHYKESKTKTGKIVRSWASIAQPKQNLEFSVKEAVRLLEFYEDYFGTPYPLDKCDQVALPDFESGAMENWGLITYREIALLTDPENPSLPTDQYVAMVIAHELSHQWFGNLVTMRWWDDLWLNESFASLMEHISLDVLHPDWHQWENYVSQDVIAASNRDIYTDVQAVGTKVNHPDEISTLFDPAIVYAKGGRLLKMLREYIGDEAFREALRSYFKKHAFKNTVRDDLWREMSSASGKDIDALMTPWLTQSGMPVIKVDKNNKKDERLITQSRFTLDKDIDGRTWPIPLLASPAVKPEVLIARHGTINLENGSLMTFINANASGHFLVNYDTEDLQTIISRVAEGSINSEARITFLNDLMLLARRGDISLSDGLRVVETMDNEPRDAVWTIMIRMLGLAASLGEFDKDIESGLKKLRYKMSNSQYKELGWEDKKNEDPNTTLLRSTIASMLLGSEDKEMLDFVLDKYDSTEIAKIPSDRRNHVLSTVIKHRNEQKDYDLFVKTYKTTHDPDMQLSISAALTATRSKETGERLIHDALGQKGFVRGQDYFRWYAYLMRNKHTRELAWEWLIKSWDRLYSEFGGGKSMDYFVTFSAGPINTDEWESKFLEFFTPKQKDVSLERNIVVAKSEIRARIEWRDRDLKNLQNYFKSLR